MYKTVFLHVVVKSSTLELTLNQDPTMFFSDRKIICSLFLSIYNRMSKGKIYTKRIELRLNKRNQNSK